MLEILNDDFTYEKTVVAIDKIMKTVKDFIKRHDKYFTDKEMDYLTNFDYKLAYIYGKPKIHKCKNLQKLVQTGTHTKNSILTAPFNEVSISMRPIVSGTKCPTSRLCQLAKKLLRPFENEIEHLIIDSIHFLSKLPEQISGKKLYMLTIDIVALYPSIPNELGLEALKYFFEKYPSNFIKTFDNIFTLDLVKFIQANVFLSFNEDTYKQKEGTAMGKNHAPQYANMVIAFLILTKLYPKIQQKHGLTQLEHVKNNIFIYLDDGFVLLDEDIITAETLISYLNEMTPKIKFTFEKSNSEIAFLDVLVTMTELEAETNNEMKTFKISTDIYHKPTDAFNYFNFKSCGPRHIKRNIPYTLSRRIKTIVTCPETRKIRYNAMKSRLLEKDYPIKLIDDSIKKAENLNRSDLLKRKTKTVDKNMVTLVINHNPKIIDPTGIIMETTKNLRYASKVSNGKRTIPKITIARRQPPNLLRILSLSKKRDHNVQNTKHISTYDYSKCKDKRCELCPIAISGSQYTTKSGYTLRRNTSMTCKSKDLLYLLTCNGCDEEYIGETGIPLNRRMNLHRNQIKNEKYTTLKMSKHVRECGNNEFKVFPFFKCYKQCHIYREKLENKFRTLAKPKLH